MRGYPARMRLLTLLLTAVVVLVVAAPALADDQSVFDAWTRENTTLAKHEKALGKNLKSWSDSGLRKGGPALERISKIRALIARRRAAVLDEDPSTGDGGSGRKNALAALRDYNAAMLKLRSAINAGMDGNGSRANSYLKQYDALIDRSQKYERRALAAFERAGVT
jgi:hypothetical protein